MIVITDSTVMAQLSVNSNPKRPKGTSEYFDLTNKFTISFPFSLVLSLHLFPLTDTTTYVTVNPLFFTPFRSSFNSKHIYRFSHKHFTYSF